MCSEIGRSSPMRSRRSRQPSFKAATAAVSAGGVDVGVATEGKKTRTRIRKPRYVSLTKLEERDEEMDMRLIDLFPIRIASVKKEVKEEVVDEEELVVEVKEAQAVTVEEEESQVSTFFYAEECDTSTSLTGLLDSRQAASELETVSAASELETVSAASDVVVVKLEESVEREMLVRAALRRSRSMDKRSGEEEEKEEKWVSLSDVSVSSSAAVYGGELTDRRKNTRLQLKLDYQEVLEAWDGEPFVGDRLHIVPDLDEDVLLGFCKVEDDGNVAWTVSDQDGKMMAAVKEEDYEMKWKMGQMREASLLRYKEKRQTRLYSKRIRYEVRKLNAEKRPRIKGRFVRRD